MRQMGSCCVVIVDRAVLKMEELTRRVIDRLTDGEDRVPMYDVPLAQMASTIQQQGIAQGKKFLTLAPHILVESEVVKAFRLPLEKMTWELVMLGTPETSSWAARFRYIHGLERPVGE